MVLATPLLAATTIRMGMAGRASVVGEGLIKRLRRTSYRLPRGVRVHAAMGDRMAITRPTGDT